MAVAASALADTLYQRVNALFTSDETAMLDPFPIWRELQATGPVHEFGPTILVTRHPDVFTVMRDAERFSSAGKQKGSLIEEGLKHLNTEQRQAFDQVHAFTRLYMSHKDGSDHTRVRSIAHRAFTPSRIAALGEAAERYLDKLLAPMLDEDVSDFLDVAYELPLMVMGDLLGLPDGDRALIHELGEPIGRSLGGVDPEPIVEAAEAIGALKDYVAALLDEHRRNPGISEFVTAVMDAEQEELLAPEEITAMFAHLLFAGHITTTTLLGIGLLDLMRNREQWDLLCSDPEGMAVNTTEELLRYVTPLHWAYRLPTEDVELAGTLIPAGTTIVAMLACANRDPDVFEEPDMLDLNRFNCNRQITFGIGPHFCLGAALSRLEGQIVFRSIASRFPEMELATDEFRFVGNAALRALESLPVRLGHDHGARRSDRD